MRSAFLALALAAGLPASMEAAGVVGTGSSASCTEAALNLALSGGGAVTFNCGGGLVTIPITATKTVTVSTTIDGTGQQVTLDGGGTTRLFINTYANSGSASLTLRNLTLRNGRAADFGGAIRLVYRDAPFTLTVENVTFANNVCTAAGSDVGGGAIHAGYNNTLSITNSVFTGNRGGNGGAIGQIGARFTITDTTFSGNATHPRDGTGNGGNGGAIYIDGSNNGTLALVRTVFTGNSASNLGGAIHTYMYGLPSNMTIDQSTFASNAGTTNGGAIFHMNGGLTITGSTFSANTVVGQGGALWTTDGGGGTPVAVTNSTFTGNQATGTRPNNGSVGLGGAIRAGGTALTLTNVTIAGNHADWVGGGIVGGSTAFTLKNSIVANNTAANGGNPWNIGRNCSNTLGNGGGNIEWPNLNPSDSSDKPCSAGILFSDPRLGPLAANGGLTQTMSLLSGSPALNGGVACPPPATDQRGVTRPQGAACDSGAFEGRPQADLSITKTDNGASPLPGQGLTYTIVARNNGPTAVSGAPVTDAFPSSLTGVSWTCVASAGSACPASGFGGINQNVDLLVAGTATFTANVTVDPSATRLVANTATIAVPAANTVEDPNPANNTATVVTLFEHPLAFHTVSPCRVVDTRGAVGPVGAPALAAGASRTFPVVGRCTVPATAWAVSVNAVVTSATAAGNLRVFPGGTPIPASSTLNYAAGQTRANSATVSLGPAGDLAVFCGQATGTADFILDVNGYFE